jgi:hypothetical protein
MMNQQRFFDTLCRGLTLCIEEISKELASGLVTGPERGGFEKCLAELNETRAKLRQAQAGVAVSMDQTFWFNLDDALYALEEITPRFAGADELERVRDRIVDWQNELALAQAVGCARTAA